MYHFSYHLHLIELEPTDGLVGYLSQVIEVPVILSLFSDGGVEDVGQVFPLLLQFNVFYGEFAEALLQVLDTRRRGRVLGLPVDQKEHKAYYDKRLNKRGEEEDDAHVVATALALRVVLHLLLSWTELFDLGIAAAIHWSPRSRFSSFQNYIKLSDTFYLSLSFNKIKKLYTFTTERRL